jgi:transporter family-2 protein
MRLSLIPLIIAALSGVSMAVQGSLNAVLGKVVGMLEATMIVHLIGTLVALFALFGLGLGRGNLSIIDQVPWYAYLGGAIGVIIIFGVVFSIPRVGVANATTAIIIGQVAAALLIDYLGLFGLERICITWWNGLGLLFLALGGYFMLFR